VKPFDRKAAVRGEPVQALVDGGWTDVKYVGVGYNDHFIIDHPQHGSLRIRSAESLRMAPKVTVLAIEIWRDPKGGFWTNCVDQYGVSHGYGFGGHDWKKIETLHYQICE